MQYAAAFTVLASSNFPQRTSATAFALSPSWTSPTVPNLGSTYTYNPPQAASHSGVHLGPTTGRMQMHRLLSLASHILVLQVTKVPQLNRRCSSGILTLAPKFGSELILTDLAERSEAPNPGDQKGAEPPFLAAPRPMGGVAASI